MARSGRVALRRVLNGAINASLADPNMQARFVGLGAESMNDTRRVRKIYRRRN
jgi:hypothetical protein